MPHILVATDFSEVGENAVNYACELASAYKASITILHSFIIPVTFSDTPMPVMPLDEGRAIAEERMEQFVKGLRVKFSGLEILSKVMFGDIVDCLEDHTKEEKPWFIILGNSVNEDTSLWLGSNVVSALRNLRNIVVAVPVESKYKKLEKICFACDFKNVAANLPFEDLLNLVRALNAELHVVNVGSENKNDNSAEGEELQQLLSAVNPVYHYVEKENVDEAIKDFVDENHMDWLIMMPHKHSFFEGLFHKSHTKAMVKISPIPIAALHEK